MTPERINQIAAEFYTFLAADNDKIANDPRRWHEELTSWSMEDLGNVVAALITKAVNETAALDLLAALERVMSYSAVRNALECEDNDAALAAIAKAKGEA